MPLSGETTLADRRKAKIAREGNDDESENSRRPDGGQRDRDCDWRGSDDDAPGETDAASHPKRGGRHWEKHDGLEETVNSRNRATLDKRRFVFRYCVTPAFTGIFRLRLSIANFGTEWL